MTKRMLVDAAHPEETRVAVISGNRLEDFDFETATRARLKGNIYLAKVTRVEPSLQAAFVDYGGNRHGFLAFSEIHPDYYRIPVEDRQALLAEYAAHDHHPDEENSEEGIVETLGGEDNSEEEAERRRRRSSRRYKIQEVIKRRQILLVQVVKEERGNKGAALTTYLSLAGRYCVLMPNTTRGGGISRKISDAKDRQRLKDVLSGLNIPENIGIIVRTAGAGRTKIEIKRDYEYLLRLWNDIREKTLASIAPCLIYAEGSLLNRSLRDIYTKDIEEILVEGDEGFKRCRDIMKELMPSHAKRVKLYKEANIPLFQRFEAESQIDAIYSPRVQLRSGGSIVINQTEALVAIDVNSGRSTRERNIEETALKTNLEAAEEVARQLRLRDLAGLIVIDFIDMEEARHQHQVERRLKEAIKIDRARIQVGRISHFGLLELSRQRLRPSVAEASTEVCPHCGGSGMLRSTESTALHVLRAIEDEGTKKRAAEVSLAVPTAVAFYLLNQKRAALFDIEKRYGFTVMIVADHTLTPPAFRLTQTRALPGTPTLHERADSDQTALAASEIVVPATGVAEGETDNTGSSGGRRRRRRRRGRRNEVPADLGITTTPADFDHDLNDETILPINTSSSETENGEDTSQVFEQSTIENGEDRRKRRRRGRRGGRRRRPENSDNNAQIASSEDVPWMPPGSSLPEGLLPSEQGIGHEIPPSSSDDWLTPRNPPESMGQRRSRPKPADKNAKINDNSDEHPQESDLNPARPADRVRSHAETEPREEDPPDDGATASPRRGWWKRLVT
ncbi:MAG: ribonuclease E/G [Alphaproteobacteria bacterium]